MTVATKVKKWGNSLAVRLPGAIVGRLKITEGSRVAIQGNGERIVIQKTPRSGKRYPRDAWKQFVLPTNRKKENVSGEIDVILYDAAH